MPEYMKAHTQNDPVGVSLQLHFSTVALQKLGLFAFSISHYTMPIASQLVLHLPYKNVLNKDYLRKKIETKKNREAGAQCH